MDTRKYFEKEGDAGLFDHFKEDFILKIYPVARVP